MKKYATKDLIWLVACTFIGLKPGKPVTLELIDMNSDTVKKVAEGTPTRQGRILLETTSLGQILDQQIFLHDCLGLRLTSENKVIYFQMNCFTGWRKVMWFVRGGWLRALLKSGIYISEIESDATYG